MFCIVVMGDCLNMKDGWYICLFCVGPGYDEVLCGEIYVEGYGICVFVVFLVDEICVDYGGVYV